MVMMDALNGSCTFVVPGPFNPFTSSCIVLWFYLTFGPKIDHPFSDLHANVRADARGTFHCLENCS